MSTKKKEIYPRKNAKDVKGRKKNWAGSNPAYLVFFVVK